MNKKAIKLLWNFKCLLNEDLLFDVVFRAADESRTLCCQFEPLTLEQTISLFRRSPDENFDEGK